MFDNTYKTNDVIEDKFKLTSTKSLSNLHLYNRDGVIHKYDTIYQIIDEHFYTRLNMYERRKEHQINQLTNEIKYLDAKMRFINYVIDEKIVVYKQQKVSIIEVYEFPFYINNCIIDYELGKVITNEYNYLLNMPIHNFTLEKVDELETDIDMKNDELDILTNTDIKDIWIKELDEFEVMYKRHIK